MIGAKPRFDVTGQLESLRRYARSLTRNDADAEDLVHAALLRAYEKRGSFQDGRPLKPWLLAILHNVHVDGQRARQAEARRNEHAAGLQEPFAAPAQEHHVRLAQVHRAFMELPEEQRAVLHLVAIEGLSFAEAAGALDIPLGTVMSRLARARAALRAVEDAPATQPDPGDRRRRLKIVGGSGEPTR